MFVDFSEIVLGGGPENSRIRVKWSTSKVFMLVLLRIMGTFEKSTGPF